MYRFRLPDGRTVRRSRPFLTVYYVPVPRYITADYQAQPWRIDRAYEERRTALRRAFGALARSRGRVLTGEPVGGAA